VSVALIAVNIVVYAPVAHHEFLSWDDPQYLLDNPHISGGLTWPAVSWALTSGYASNWHPLTWWSHMLDVQLYGLSAGPHHLTNLLLHIANTLLLFGLLHAMTGALGRSAFVAALFATHPLHVESVAWVAERKDVLSTLFWMLTVWAYLWYLAARGEGPAPRPRRRFGRYSVMVALFGLGLMAKPMLVTLPLVLLLLDAWPLGRVTPGNDDAVHSGLALLKRQRSAWLPLVREKLPLLALAGASSVITFVVQRKGGAVAAFEALPLGDRVANALVSYMRYIGKMLWPVRLAAVYPLSRPIPLWWVVWSLGAFCAISVVVMRAARRYPYLALGWLWYVGTLVPVIGVIQVGSQSMADRYTYIPFIGLFIIVAWGGTDLIARWPRRRQVLPIIAGVAIAACMVVARHQVGYWRDSLALWGHAVDVTHDNYIAQNGLGEALAAHGRVDEAIAHLSEAVRLSPDFPFAQNNLGVELKRQGHWSDAIAHYSEALRTKPDFAEAHNNLANALDAGGRTSEAITHYTEALRTKPDYAEAHNGLGVALAKTERLGEAIDHFSAAVRIKPDSVDAYNNLGIALALQGRREDAIHEFSEALRVSPGNPLARRSLQELTTR
jgi:tetratricopeptide (TPR) repeat protein